jgi:predicted dehydrogenase
MSLTSTPCAGWWGKVKNVGSSGQGSRAAGAPALAVGGSQVAMVADVRQDAAATLAASVGCPATSQWGDIVARDDVDAVIICTPPHLHAEIAVAAMRAGKHVLCEKPLARSVDEAQAMVRAARESGVRIKCGFNLRHHPGIHQAHQWYEAGAIGEIDWIRGRYGIGGRPRYEQDWRAREEVSGGGQLMDQGVHLLDLAAGLGTAVSSHGATAETSCGTRALLRTATGRSPRSASWAMKPLFRSPAMTPVLSKA